MFLFDILLFSGITWIRILNSNKGDRIPAVKNAFAAVVVS